MKAATIAIDRRNRRKRRKHGSATSRARWKARGRNKPIRSGRSSRRRGRTRLSASARRRRRLRVHPSVTQASLDLLRAQKAEQEAIEQGINIIGYSRSETGMGESCRLAARAIETAGLPFGIMHVGLDNLVNI